MGRVQCDERGKSTPETLGGESRELRGAGDSSPGRGVPGSHDERGVLGGPRRVRDPHRTHSRLTTEGIRCESRTPPRPGSLTTHWYSQGRRYRSPGTPILRVQGQGSKEVHSPRTRPSVVPGTHPRPYEEGRDTRGPRRLCRDPVTRRTDGGCHEGGARAHRARRTVHPSRSGGPDPPKGTRERAGNQPVRQGQQPHRHQKECHHDHTDVGVTGHEPRR